MRKKFPVRPAALVAFIFIVVLALACGGGDGLQNDGTEGPTAAVSVSAGTFHTCAVMAEGGVKCWGSNNLGQLGDGTNTDRNTPVDVVGLTSGVAAISASRLHTCALTTAGGVKCWGRVLQDPLTLSEQSMGDGMATDEPTAVDVQGLTSGVVAITTGVIHTCALTNEGGVKCWGYNREGQLGNGEITDRGVPVDVEGLTDVVAIAAGWKHTCAITTGGGLKCWGWNNGGQIGDTTTTDRTTPVDVVGLTSGVTAVAAGRLHTCAVTTAGGVKCWGLNDGGQVGDGTNDPHFSPVDVVGLNSGVAAVSTGLLHSCIVTTTGGLKCWGVDSSGQLGDGAASIQHRTEPVDVVGFDGR